MVLEGDLTLVRAMNSTSIGKLSTLIEKVNVIKAITFLLLRLSEHFNVGKKLSSEQSAVLALDLFEIFNYETLEDVVLMFKWVRQGKIGDGKDYKLDGQTILHKFVPAYLELKSEEREKNHNRKKGEMNMTNFDWSKEDLEKFKTSGEKNTFLSGLGQKAKEKLDVPTTTPLRDHSVYLNLLKETVKGAKTKDLVMAKQRLKEEEKLDELEIVQLELNKR